MTQVFIDLFIFIYLLSPLLSNYIFIISKYWPDVQYAETSSDYDSFWEHEWTKHGTCSGLAQATFFQDTINLIEKYGTPSVLTSAAGKTIDADTLRTAMGGKTLWRCSAPRRCSMAHIPAGAGTAPQARH